MAAQPTCLVCQKVMEPGFMTDLGDQDTVQVPRWCPGTPIPTRWGNEVQRSQRAVGLKVIAFRCPDCEALRLYAPSTPTTP